MKTLNKVLTFIKDHPYITTFLIFTILCFFDGAEQRQWNFHGYYIMALLVCCVISPFVRRYNDKKERIAEADHLAKQIALEQDKIANPDKYKE